jgi:two-component sensor histidine kinase
MVDMQILNSTDDQFLKKLQEIQSVIDTMALIYSRAYEGARIQKFKLKDFINELTSGLLKFKTDSVEMIDIMVIGDEIELETDKAIPIVLIVNELIFNSLKHAFIGCSNGKIDIELNKNTDHFIIKIEDNGVGFPTEFTLDKVSTLGLRIVRNLVGQLKGEIDFETENGAKINIKIPFSGVE